MLNFIVNNMQAMFRKAVSTIEGCGHVDLNIGIQTTHDVPNALVLTYQQSESGLPIFLPTTYKRRSTMCNATHAVYIISKMVPQGTVS